jgi:excinuclease UvrABC ATPase subunit
MVDNVVYNLSDELPSTIQDPWIIVDRVEIDTTDSTQLDRLSQSISTAFEYGEDVVGIMDLSIQEKYKAKSKKQKEGIEVFSRAFRCPHCGYVPSELTLSHFSFNSPA